MLLEGTVSLSRYAWFVGDGHWPCNGFTSSTVSATGLRAVGASRPPLGLVFLLDQACASIGFASAQR